MNTLLTGTNMQYPVFEEEAIPELGLALEGCFPCRESGVLRGSKKSMARHCKEEHGLASTQSNLEEAERATKAS
jgi:hypothetical protein